MIPRTLLVALGAEVSLFQTASGAEEHEIFEPKLKDFYGDFKVPHFKATTYEEIRPSIMKGLPLVVDDGAQGLPMSDWDCDNVGKKFPNSVMRHEGGGEHDNKIKLSSDWKSIKTPFPGAEKFPEGAPRLRPFYWDIVKAADSEKDRNWGANPKSVTKEFIKQSSMPYFLPKGAGSANLGATSEMWFHPPDAGAAAHMDPHCSSTVSFTFSGTRTWRVMVPPPIPHKNGYFDGEIYGVNDKKRKGEWQPHFEANVTAGSAIIIHPGQIHETHTIGDVCSSAITQQFTVPTPTAYYRAFWPRMAFIKEDIGRCSYLVEFMALFGSKGKIVSSDPKKAAESGAKFAKKMDSDGDGFISAEEIEKARGTNKNVDGQDLKLLSTADLIAFHDTDGDGKVTTQEAADSWAMYSTSMHRLKNRKKYKSQFAKEEL